jgi:hypothetical protein
MSYIKIFLSLFIIALVLTGCSTTNLIKYEDDSDCQTTLEGKYNENNVLTVDYPCLFIKDKRGPYYAKGELLQRDSAGVLFKRKSGGLYSLDPIYYPLDTLIAAVDTSGRAFYGKIPDKYLCGVRMTIELEELAHPERDKLFMELSPGQSFSYCMEPGEYRIKQIVWEDEEKNVMEGIGFPEITFNIDPGKVNYFGDIYIDKNQPDDPGVINIPYKSWNRDNASAMGALFGVIGSAAYSLSYDMSDAEDIKVMDIRIDENFLPVASYQIVPVEIHIKARKEDNR